MDCSTSASLSDDSGSEHDKNGVESVNNDNDDDDTISVQSDTHNSNDHDISDDDEQQVFLLIYAGVI
jgi:hypothetical protein